MKSTVEYKAKDDSIKYPVLMHNEEDNNTIILFTSDSTGTIVASNTPAVVGVYRDDLDIGYCEPFEGRVILDNNID